MYQKLRPAIAMIELIFALVIMGITMMSAPMLISQASKSNYTSFQQESIAIIASHTNALLTYAWDEQNTESKIQYENTILRVTNGNVALSETNRTIPGKRKYSTNPAAVATTALGADANDTQPDDVDDFSGVTRSLTATINATIGDGEYIDQNISLATQVNYIQENTVNYATNTIVYNLPQTTQATSSNIKFITTTLTSTSPSSELSDKNIVLRAFMCNIGGTPPDSSEDFSTGQLQNAPVGYY